MHSLVPIVTIDHGGGCYMSVKHEQSDLDFIHMVY
jgi:hypothetical protein